MGNYGSICFYKCKNCGKLIEQNFRDSDDSKFDEIIRLGNDSVLFYKKRNGEYAYQPIDGYYCSPECLETKMTEILTNIDNYRKEP